MCKQKLYSTNKYINTLSNYLIKLNNEKFSVAQYVHLLCTKLCTPCFFLTIYLVITIEEEYKSK